MALQEPVETQSWAFRPNMMQGVYEKSTGKLIQRRVLGMDLPKCCSSYLCHLLNPSQTEGFLFFLLKIHFTADFNRLLLLCRLVKRILCSHLWKFLNILLFTKMPSSYLSLWAFQGKQVCPLSMNWLLIHSSEEQMVISYFAYSQSTSTAAYRQSSSLFQIKANSFYPTSKFHPSSSKTTSLTSFSHLSNERSVFLPNT